jgi:outer membrane receptor protein involved in Fe transport
MSGVRPILGPIAAVWLVSQVATLALGRGPRGQFHLAYAYQTATGHGSVNGGLTDFSSGGGDFPLDHDQRHTLSAGVDARLPHGVLAATTVYYGSGLPDDGGPAYPPGHTTVDLALGKSFGKNVSLSVTALNVTNNYLLIGNSLTFGGTHFNSPREVYAQLRYRFHY